MSAKTTALAETAIAAFSAFVYGLIVALSNLRQLSFCPQRSQKRVYSRSIVAPQRGQTG